MKQNNGRSRIQRWLGVWLAALILLGLNLNLPAAAAVLRLDADTGRHDTAGYIERLDDPGASLDAARADASPGWTALPGGLSAGYTPVTVWLRLTLDIPRARPEGWVLRLGNAVLDDVRVYSRDDGETWDQLGHSGEDVPRGEWPVDFRSPAFLFSPAREGRHVLLVRLQSKNAMMTRLEVWPRAAFDNHSRREGLLFGVYAGFYLLLIGLYAIYWLGTRAPMSGLLLAYIANCVSNEALSLGLVQQLTGLPVAWSDSLLGVGLASSLAIALTVALRQLELERCYPRSTRALILGGWAIAGVGALLVLSGRYGAGVQPVQWAALALIPLLSGLAVFLTGRGWQPARYFLAVFGVFYAGVLIGYLRNLRLLPINEFTEHASLLGTMVHMLLLSFVLIGRHERRRRERERQQAHLAADLARQHNVRLERDVAERTVDLSREIRRREQVEDELRQALEAEREVMAEQREFVAMVSHEFRTPLAIIGTSAQQLGRSLDRAPVEKNQARCRNIRDASLRLLALVDEYLTEDRIREPRTEREHEPCNLQAMLGELAQAFAPGRVRCIVEPHGATVRGDAGLLHIALRNLLANADRHAPAGEHVDVVARIEGGAIRIDVSNPGVLIPERERERLFQKYYRGQNAQSRAGAGLGLYLVRQIAARLNGSVTLVRTGGHEPVTFRFSLPCRPGT
ncbi:MAG: sensor histidine kinase [Variovorax sp.]|nr:sensor histidine kinase [Variovorax sp.]